MKYQVIKVAMHPHSSASVPNVYAFMAVYAWPNKSNLKTKKIKNESKINSTDKRLVSFK